ncbi:tyrosine-type recombinase/integrase [Stieleria varia]|uniref:tyrosine-type recombinase/integrase n=1 Tax=Stieleria varia TaxID=2528005 RepID=UPI001E654790|nr:tyrosine-type recombinase/integrase [Stieleria varia]
MVETAFPSLTMDKRIGDAGKAANVIVARKRADGTKQHATAHDFRRSFGARWAPKVMPVVLQQLMRHESIETTLKYYVGINADRTGDALWAAQPTAELGEMLDALDTFVTVPKRDEGAVLGDTLDRISQK